ncbi:endonuclease domain-containing protein [Luteimonas notoginsengisoli]|uniref:Endonuclease domain-containing protein n=1 Tax=Luteimonas notoginsengisoli TaxID=1578200 RepID=A0ABV7UUM2_9GAMM
MEEIWKNARSLRNNATDAEQHLWQQLRGRQLAGYKFRRQYPIAGFIADFACIEARLVVELDGGQHVERTAEDAARTRRIECNGYRVPRFWNDDVLVDTEVVLGEILRSLK